MLGLFKKKSSNDDIALVKQALGPQVVVVVSASCCMPGTAEVDAQAKAAAQAALTGAGLDWPVLSVTVTQAQSTLHQVSGELGVAQSALAAQVTELFMSQGLGAFPVVLAHQRLVSYGGVPTADLIRKALPNASANPAPEAHHAHAA